MVFLLVLMLLVSTPTWSDTLKTYPDIPYRDLPGVDSKLLSLDLYAREGLRNAPVMVMVHGGSFIKGDKSGRLLVHPKMDYYTSKGWVFVSVNYRLTRPKLGPDHPDQISHPDHVNDVAAATVWVKNNVSRYGGDPARIVLVGHSAGAILVTLLATDESRLAQHQMSASELAGVIALDSYYDLPKRLPRAHPLMPLAIGSDRATQLDMSPVSHVKPGDKIPPMLLVSKARGETRKHSLEMLRLLRRVGARAYIFSPANKSHGELGADLGRKGDVLTVRVDRFLKEL